MKFINWTLIKFDKEDIKFGYGKPIEIKIDSEEQKEFFNKAIEKWPELKGFLRKEGD